MLRVPLTIQMQSQKLGGVKKIDVMLCVIKKLLLLLKCFLAKFKLVFFIYFFWLRVELLSLVKCPRGRATATKEYILLMRDIPPTLLTCQKQLFCACHLRNDLGGLSTPLLTPLVMVINSCTNDVII